MKIIAVHRYFWPDTPPYASLLRSIAGRWSADGHGVTVLSSPPSYTSSQRVEDVPRSQELDGFTVTRVPALKERGGGWRQLVNLVGFPVTIASAVARRDADVLMCSTVPQVTLGVAMAAVAKLRGMSFVYHCMDLQPEIGRLSGEFAHPVVYRTLLAADTWAMRQATRIIVLSEDMAAAVRQRDETLAERVVILNNFSLPGGDEPVGSPLPPPETGTLRVVFTGNVGRFQGLDAVVDAMAQIPGETPVQLVFMGEGRAKSELVARAEGLDLPAGVEIVFLPHGSPASAKALMRSAHVGLVSLQPEVVRYAFPSKTATYAEQGLPMLVVCEGDSELAGTVVTEGLGWHAAPGDAAAIASGLMEAARELRDGIWRERHERVRRYAVAEFDAAVVLGRWSRLLDQIAEERAAHQS